MERATSPETTSESSVAGRLALVRLVAMDVDGVLTDGGVTLSGDGPETKRFHVADGLGIQLLLHAGLDVAWLSGRNSDAVTRRAAELGVSHVYQDAPHKGVPLAELMGLYSFTATHIAFIGDDLNDLPAFAVAGVKFAPSNAATEIKAIADFVTERPGGEGAVREVCDTILKAQGRFNAAVEQYLARLLAGRAAGQ